MLKMKVKGTMDEIWMRPHTTAIKNRIYFKNATNHHEKSSDNLHTKSVNTAFDMHQHTTYIQMLEKWINKSCEV